MELKGIADAVERHSGTRPRRLYRIPSDNLVIDCDGRFIFKAGPTRRLAAEAWCCERLRREGIPAPEVLAFDDGADFYPSPFLLFEKVEGAPLAAGDPAAVQAGRLLRRMHGIVLAGGWGWIDASEPLPDGSPAASRSTWRDAVTEDWVEGLQSLGHARLIEGREVERFAAALGRHDAVLDEVDQPRFTHGAMQPMHVLTGGGRVTAFIDFEHVIAGDPLWDLATLSQESKTLVAEVLEGYDPDRLLRDKLATVIPFYGLVWLIGVAAWEVGRAGDPQPHLRSMRSMLAELPG